MSLSDRENTDLSISDEDIEFLQNHPYKLTIPLEELILPSGKTPHKSKKNQSSKIPRPQNKWILFRRDYEAGQRKNSSEKETLRTKDVSTDAKRYWGNR